MSLFRD